MHLTCNLSGAGVLLVTLLTVGCVSWGTDRGAVGASKQEHPVIKEFAGLPWGASEQQIREKFGEPITRQSNPGILRGRGTILAYRGGKPFFDRDVPMFFMLHPEEGLVKGYYQVSLSTFEGDCRDVIRTIERRLRKRYPGIKPWKGKQNESNMDFCRAQRQGKAGMRMVWEDPKTGARAGFSLVPGNTSLSLVFQSKTAERWERVGPEETEEPAP